MKKIIAITVLAFSPFIMAGSCTTTQLVQASCIAASTGEQLTIAVSADFNSKNAAAVQAGAAKAQVVTNQACNTLANAVPAIQAAAGK